MKKILLGIGLVCLTTITAKATSITWIDSDQFNPVANPSTRLAVGGSFIGAFSISSNDGDGFNSLPTLYSSALHTITDVEISFDLTREGTSATWKASAFLNGTLFDSQSKTAVQMILDGTDLGDPGISVSAWIALTSTGNLTYEIRNTGTTGNRTFHINEARLVVSGESVPSVPDGGSTVSLLGTAIVGMSACLRRKN